MNVEKNNQLFKSFIDSITKNSKVAIIHDTDMDGNSAGVLVNKGLQQLNKTISLLFPKEHGGREITNNFLSQLQESQTTHIICVDLALENYVGTEKLKDYNVLVLDHHPTIKPYEESFSIIKPENIQNKVKNFQYCAAHLTYTLFSTITDMSSYDWIALTGIISDMTYMHHQEFVKETLKKYDIEWFKDAYNTTFANLVKQGGYGGAFGSDNANEIVFNALNTSNNYLEAVEKMSEFNPVKEEQRKLLSEFQTKREKHKNIYFYDIESKYHLGSPLSTIISKKQIKEDEIVIVLQNKTNKQTSASARRQDCKLHIGDMLRECVATFENSNGGGHIPAAGAKFPTKNKDQFKENVITWVKTHDKK